MSSMLIVVVCERARIGLDWTETPAKEVAKSDEVSAQVLPT